MATRRTLLSTRSFLLYCSWMALGIFAMHSPFFLAVWALAGLLGAMLLVRDRRQTLKTASPQLSLRLSSNPELHTSCTISAEIDWVQDADPFTATIRPPASTLLRFASSTAAFGPLPESPQKARAILQGYAFRLGFESIDEATIEVASPLGLWIRRENLPLSPPLRYRVSPALPPPPPERLKSIIAQQRILVSGSREALRSRTRDQFHSLRPYQYPDPIKDLDAKKSAKYQKPMVRLFESLHQHRIILALDVGRSTMGTIAGSPLFDFFISSILTIARDALHHRDALSFIAFARSVRCTMVNARSMRSLAPLLEGNEALRPREEEADYEVLARFISQHGGSRSIVLLFTDVSRPATQQALLRTLQPLCSKHLVVVLGVTDAEHSLEQRILDYSPGSTLSDDDFWDHFYSYHLDEAFTHFRSRIGRLGGAALQIPHTYWMGTTERVYELLRSSLRL